MLEYVASVRNYTLFHNTRFGNYKIKDGRKEILNPSTLEDGYTKLDMLSNIVQLNKCPGCNKDITSCNDCERY